nr:hypothetical protein [Tanacetum cinerariifolium]
MSSVSSGGKEQQSPQEARSSVSSRGKEQQSPQEARSSVSSRGKEQQSPHEARSSVSSGDKEQQSPHEVRSSSLLRRQRAMPMYEGPQLKDGESLNTRALGTRRTPLGGTPAPAGQVQEGGFGSENAQTSPSAKEVGGYSSDGSSRSRRRCSSRSTRKHQKNVSRKKGISKSHPSVRSEARSRSKSKSVKSKPRSEYLLEFTFEYGISEALHSELPDLGERIVDFPEGKVDMDLFNLIRAPNPTKVKTSTRPRAAHEVPLLTVTASRVIDMEDPAAAIDSSGVPSVGYPYIFLLHGFKQEIRKEDEMNEAATSSSNPEIKRISLTEFSAQSIGSSNTDVLELPCLLLLIIETSQSRQHDKSESDSYYLSD